MTSEQRIVQGRYRLVYKLGAGGMGSVWLAEDRWLERPVALKELVQHANGVDLDESRARVLREARAMARIRHPAIVSIHDVFFDGDDPWIVMEHINGRSLDGIIMQSNRDTAPLSELELAKIGLPVVRGLSAAHRADVVHRDVKPANILVGADDSIFLVDFGIAKISGDASLTGLRRVIGTTEFLAPERLLGADVGPSADLWSLGVTLFYGLEGYSPFLRTGELMHEATMRAILDDSPPRPVREGPLADVILRLLEKSPIKRAGADELAAVLLAIVTGGPSRSGRVASAEPPSPERPGSRRPGADPATVRMTAPMPPGRPPYPSRAAQAKPSRLDFDDAREVIQNVSKDTGVAMLLDMPGEQAARILASYPSREGGELLQGIVAARLAAATAILRMLRTPEAGRVVGYMKAESAASILATMPVDEVLRIISHMGVRTAAGIIATMPIEVSAQLAKSMQADRAADVLSYVKPATVAALLNAAPDGSSGGLLRQLKPDFRAKVMRFL
jgi:serine/threonine protein kinase/flagellar motility protein MotE (MotC chaperone)